MSIKTLKQLPRNLKTKKVLLRSDLNSEMIRGKPSDSERIKQSAETIKELLKRKASVVILTHQGSSKDLTSLKKHARLLNKYVKVKFIKSTINRKAIKEIRNLKNEALLLENVRFLKEEFNPSKNNKLVKTLAAEFDYFVNDAFSVCHRNQTSIVSFPEVLPSYLGLLAERELKAADKIKKKNATFLLGGAKIKDLMVLTKKNNKILSTGLFCLAVLSAKGVNIGKQEKDVREYAELLKNVKIQTPVDFAIEIKGKRKEISITDLPTKHRILDIGTNTIKLYSEEIKKSKAILMKGSPGQAEKKQFEKGTKELIKSISKSKGYSVISGGHTTTALSRYKINKKSINHVSLSGGALLHFIAGDKLPGLDALRKTK